MTGSGNHLVEATPREEERVTPLELFFDLVFVLAFTQCTTLMAADPTWAGVVRGLFVLTVLWWTWTGYAWLTSVVDPEEGAVRIAIFAAMAAMLVAALAVPGAFDDDALAVRMRVRDRPDRPHRPLPDREPRRPASPSVGQTALPFSTAIGIALLVAASAADGVLQVGFWALALAARHGRAVPLLAPRDGSSCPATSPSGTA